MWGFAYAMEQMSKMILILFLLCLVFVPLGIWKLVEIVIWLFSHISISVN
jgi:hypothetical protein